MKAIETVLCPVDFTPVSDSEVVLAGQLAKRLGAELLIQHNMPTGAGLGVSWMHQKEHYGDEQVAEAEVRERLGALLRGLPPAVYEKTRAVITYGTLDYNVRQLVTEAAVDLVVIGTHDTHDADHPSETEKLLASQPCAVLAIHDESPHQWLPQPEGAAYSAPITTLVPVDFTDHSLQTMEYALYLSDRLPLVLTAVYVTDGRKNEMPWVEERFAAAVPPERRDGVKLDVRQGTPSTEILTEEAMLDAQLVVMGGHAHGWLSRMLSSAKTTTASELLHRSDCAVMFVP